MLKKRLFGYSKKHTDELLQQIENDFHSEEEILLDKIKHLEDKCELLKNQNEADRKKLYEARDDYNYFMKVVSDQLKRNSASK